MVCVTLWLQLLLVVLILRQSAAVSDHCSQLQEEISRLERDIMRITELRNESDLRADDCHEHLTKQILISQATDRNLTQSESVISDLKKQLDEYKTKLETKEEVLKNNNETQIQLQTDIDGLTKTAQSMNRTIERLCETPEHVCRYLFDASKSGDVKTVKILFKCNSDNCTLYRNTPLTYAAWYGKMAVVRVLLECGANVDSADGHESTALHLAAFAGHLDVCRLLLDKGAKVNHLDRWKDTPLHWAAWKGHLSVVKLLVERGADVCVKDDNGQTASDEARSTRRKDVADMLDLFACRHLLDAANSGDVNTAKILIKCSNDNCTDDDKNRNTPLIFAARYGHVEVVRVLLEGGANVDRANDAGRVTALHEAALFGHLDVCRLLLDWGAKVDRLDGRQNTALQYAARQGHLSVVKLLVERGADVSVEGIMGQTASDVARSWGSKEVADWLDKIDLLKRHTDEGPTRDEEEFMRLACCVMDANAFETAQIPKDVINNKPALSTEEERPLNGLAPSLRGLYPLAAMMNHACTPNTRHGYDEKQKMTVRAASLIAAGTEITSSYTSLLWGTAARRHHLKITKEFLCSCPRCRDPQEGGSRLAAVRCLTQSCQGSMFPEEPLEENTKWQCEVCRHQVTGRQASLTQAMLGRLLSIVDNRNVLQMERFLSQHQHIMPSSNQIVIEVKCDLIRSYGHAKGYSWADVTMQQLELKERLCREMLELLERLGAGECRMRGLLLYELHCTLMELRHRRRDDLVDSSVQNAVREALSCVEEAAEILAEDISAPLDIQHRLRTCRGHNYSVAPPVPGTSAAT